MKIGITGGILQSIVCSGPLLFWPSILQFAKDHSHVNSIKNYFESISNSNSELKSVSVYFEMKNDSI